MSPGIFNDFHPQQVSLYLTALLWTLSDPYSVLYHLFQLVVEYSIALQLPGETPALAAYPEGVWTAPVSVPVVCCSRVSSLSTPFPRKTPPPLTVHTFPPPVMIPGNDAHAPELCGVGNDNAANEKFPHACAERTNIAALQTAEFLTGIIFVEPEGKLGGIRSEVGGLFPFE